MFLRHKLQERCECLTDFHSTQAGVGDSVFSTIGGALILKTPFCFHPATPWQGGLYDSFRGRGYTRSGCYIIYGLGYLFTIIYVLSRLVVWSGFGSVYTDTLNKLT